jgi:hypothetical protein
MEIIDLYNKDPRKWHILSGRDDFGYHDIVVMHGTDVWIVKEQFINPYKSVGFSVKTLNKVNPIEKIETAQCGVRPVSQRQIEQIIETIQAGKNAHELLSEIMSQKPISLREVRSAAVVQGPVLHVNRPTHFLSPKQHDLELKLRTELEKLLMRKHSQTMIPYM